MHKTPVTQNVKLFLLQASEFPDTIRNCFLKNSSHVFPKIMVDISNCIFSIALILQSQSRQFFDNECNCEKAEVEVGQSYVLFLLMWN